MAILNTSTRMVYWRIYHGDNDTDITNIIGSYVSSIRVMKTALPVRTKDKKSTAKSEHSPVEATIDITSNNYIEEIFIPGVQIKITMGYDPLTQPTIFIGRIKNLPEGSAKDMLNYTVQAFGIETDLADKEKNRTFQIPTKTEIISQIAMENGYIWNISIADKSPMLAQFIPIQKQETDYEFIMRCADSWNCLCWFTITPAGKQLNFADADVAYTLSDGTLSGKGTYSLGYRTDKAPCNVETVAWKHRSNSMSDGVGQILGYNEFGRTTGSMEFRIANYDNKTWRLKVRYRNLIKAKGKEGGLALWRTIGKISQALTLGMNSADNYRRFKEYFEIERYNDPSKKNQTPPSGQGSGFEITVHLNEGDPTLTPPRNAFLFSGSINPKTDTAELPIWMNNSYRSDYCKLKINKTTLTYSNGLIKTELSCTMGAYGE